MTTQIDFLQNLVKESVYTKTDLESSLSLVSVAGNDYFTYLAEGGSNEGLPAFIARVVKQIAVNLKRIRDVGVGKVAVGALQPLGCLPGLTAQNSFQHCNGTYNDFVNLHNTLLRQAVAELNSESNDSGAFIVLDLYGSFTKVLNHKGGFTDLFSSHSSLAFFSSKDHNQNCRFSSRERCKKGDLIHSHGSRRRS
ncbi:hypothetical protein C3L33_02532, partial [Rhododendron williamsianum]